MALFAVIGLGNFGGTLAVELHDQGQEVIAVDKDPDVCQGLRDSLPSVIVADATDRESLEAVGIQDASQAVISLGKDLEASVLVALHCAEMGIEKIHVKALSSLHGRILKRVGASGVIFPEQDAARRLAQRLIFPNLVDYLPIAPGHSVEQVRTPEQFVGKSLAELELRKRLGVQVIAIRDPSAADSSILIPTGDTVLKEQDLLVLLGPNEKLSELSKEEE